MRPARSAPGGGAEGPPTGGPDARSAARTRLLGLTQWMAKWKRDSWRISETKVVENVGLGRLEAATATHEVTWKWVEGHSGVRQRTSR
ncbi:RNase H family protein [Actinocorallia herbida]|uniref:RNase H family protein n=1 Tax=Actinocorallia herbida TaxID=58109 RepID=UPI002482F38A|nr:RNase H family protein [Actinocorallia herbida]